MIVYAWRRGTESDKAAKAAALAALTANMSPEELAAALAGATDSQLTVC